MLLRKHLTVCAYAWNVCLCSGKRVHPRMQSLSRFSGKLTRNQFIRLMMEIPPRASALVCIQTYRKNQRFILVLFHSNGNANTNFSLLTDRVFAADETTSQLYNDIAKPLVVSTVEGYNGMCRKQCLIPRWAAWFLLLLSVFAVQEPYLLTGKLLLERPSPWWGPVASPEWYLKLWRMSFKPLRT